MSKSPSVLQLCRPLALLLACSCMPLHDLDQVSSRREANGGGSRDARGAGLDEGQDGRSSDGLQRSKEEVVTPIDALSCPPGVQTADAPPGGKDAGAQTGPGGADALSNPASGNSSDSGGASPNPDRADAAGGGPGVGQDSGGQPDANLTPAPADPLPDIDNSPVRGVLTFIANSAWGFDGVQWPAFQIHTPTATYFLLKSQAAIVSMLDSAQMEWINFSSGYRPNRGVPNLGGCCQPRSTDKTGPTMSTVLDPSMTVTSTHVRFISKSSDESTWLVWDFFLSHFTLTVNRMAKPFGFTYQGVPGGALGLFDQIVFSDGTVQSALVPHSGDLPGPAEWAFLTHPTTRHSLFLIQHADDSLADNYRLADGDTAMFTFGGRQTTQTPLRYSLGLIDSTDPQTVRKRIEFVRDAIR